MERVYTSQTLQKILRSFKRRNICVSFGGQTLRVRDGLRNCSQSQLSYKTCNPKHGLQNPFVLHKQCLLKTVSRTEIGGNVNQIRNMSISARRAASEKESEKEDKKDNKKDKQHREDLLSTAVFSGAISVASFCLAIYTYISDLPVLETVEEITDILMNNEVKTINISKYHRTATARFLNSNGQVQRYQIKNMNVFLRNLQTVYEKLNIHPSERLQPIMSDMRFVDVGFLMSGVLMIYSLTRRKGPVVLPIQRRNISKMSSDANQGRDIPKQAKETPHEPKQAKETPREPKRESKSMMEMFLGDRANAGYIRGDILSKQGNGVTFKEVAGLREAKCEVMEFVDYLKSSETVTKLGGKHPRGVLLLGPPGCGKTLLAKAVATEAGVPFFALAGSQFVEMFGGLGASRMRNLFKDARQQSPCIIYIDEIDAIGKKRNGSEHGSEEEHTLNQLLVELDGMETTEGIIMIASTNRSDVLDKALLRPGRFDRQIQIDFPTVEEREEIFHVYMKKLKLLVDYKEVAPRLAQLTTGMSGADIANICNEAALHAARHANDGITMGDFYFAIERIVAGAEKKRSVITKEDRKVVAYHEAGHALVGWLLKHTDALLQVSIVPRTNNALGFAQLAPQENYLYSNQQLFDRMCMMLGGRAAENITFNHVTSGAQDDLQKVTKQAYTQIRSWGMNDRVGCVSYDYSEETPLLPYSKSLANVMDEEVNRLVAKAYMATQNLLLENKVTLDLLANTLLEKESLTYDQVRELIGPPPHGDKIKLETMKIMSDAAQQARSQSKPTEQ